MKNIVEFPNLGIKAELNRVAFEIFGHSVYWYGVIIGIGFLAAVAFAFYRRRKYGITADNIFDFVLIGLPSGIIGARFMYVLGDPSCRTNGLSGMIAIWDGGLSIYGGLIFAVLACMIYLKIKKMNILRTLDFAVPSFMIGQIIGRWGNFVNAEVYGRPTQAFLGMRINGAEEMVHPLFLYEGLWMLVGFIALVIYGEKRKRNGEIFALYVIWYGLGRIWMESLRDEQYVLRIFGLPLSILLSVLVIVLGVCMMVYIYVKRPPAAVENADLKYFCETGKQSENEKVGGAEKEECTDCSEAKDKIEEKRENEVDEK